jgi:mannose-6-phosphate isomerase-like protein (cupin superfamily)
MTSSNHVPVDAVGRGIPVRWRCSLPRSGFTAVHDSREVTLARSASHRQSGRMTANTHAVPVRFDGNVANIARDWSIAFASAPPGPPRRIDGYTIGVAPNIEGAGLHGGEVHPDGDEFLYVVSGTMELILDDGDEGSVGNETMVVLRSGDAYVVPRGVWHRLEALEPSCLMHVTPGPNGGHRPRPSNPD